MKVIVSVDSVVGRGVDSGVGIGFCDELDSGVDYELGEGFLLEVGSNVVSIRMTKTKSMCILVTV